MLEAFRNWDAAGKLLGKQVQKLKSVATGRDLLWPGKLLVIRETEHTRLIALVLIL